MSIVNISEQFRPNRQLLINVNTTEGVNRSTNILVSDLRTNKINLVNIQQGPQGRIGPVGPQGPAGKDGATFDLLPISSGGTNNTIFNSGYLITYNGDKLVSSEYTIDSILELTSTNTNAITGIIEGSGLQKTQLSNNNIVLDIKVGDGLSVTNNTIVVDDTIVRKFELDIGNIDGVVPLSKGGTNNTSYTLNQLVYYDGARLRSFPLSTGNIVLQGSAVTIQAGSGLIGGGDLTLPSGTVLLEIGGSADIFVEESSISLSPTGTPGVYTKVTTDAKGRVISGSNLTAADIISILRYTPWHSGNDGSGSNLDADLLDGQHGSFYRDIRNITGLLPTTQLSNLHTNDQIGMKFRINTKGLIEEVLLAQPEDVIEILGFTPLNSNSSGTLQGKLTVTDGLSVLGGKVDFYDNLPLFGTNNKDLLPDQPRGFTFNYGGIVSNRTGIFAYYPTDNKLTLITNIHGSNSVPELDPDDPTFQDDVNGGNADTVFVTENLRGDELTVLFREIADNLYVNVNQIQNIDSLKTFLRGINVSGQIRFIYGSNLADKNIPAFDMGGNSTRINSLNADLLDDQHGSYYRNASNITGSFTYENVSFEHIDGTPGRIPRFDTTGTITDSNARQTSGGDIKIDTNLMVGDNNYADSIYGLVVGENNLLEEPAINSIAVGQGNIVAEENSAAIGNKNVASGINSIAFNQGSISSAKNTVALGSYGKAYLDNQLSFGAFARFNNETNRLVEHGQYSTIAAYLLGIETNGNWVNLNPKIQLPKDKTIAFNIDILINKGFSSGVAQFNFRSGIINNATYRNINNVSQLINKTFIHSTGHKIELFNNSQLRRHRNVVNYLSSTNNSSIPQSTVQHVWSTEAPATNINKNLRYLNDYYFFNPEYIDITGIFDKNHTGSLVLDVHKPRYYATYEQDVSNGKFLIRSTSSHEFVSNSLVDAHYTSGSYFFPPSGRYQSYFLADNKRVELDSFKWNAIKYDLGISGTKLLIQEPHNFDQYFDFNLSGYLINPSSIIVTSTTNNFGYKLNSFNLKDKTVEILCQINNINYKYHRTIDSLNLSSFLDSIQINAPIQDPISNTPVWSHTPCQINIKYLSSHIFKTCNDLVINNQKFLISSQTKTNIVNFEKYSDSIFVNDGGAGTVQDPLHATLTIPQNTGIVYELDDYGNKSFALRIPQRLLDVVDGDTVNIVPVFLNNQGSVNFYSKNNFACSYSSDLSSFNANTGVYVRYIKGDKTEVRLFDTSYNEIDFISSPVVFELVDGPFSGYNHLFNIVSSGNRYFLHTKSTLNYNDYQILPVRIRCTPSNTRFASKFEKILYVHIEPTPDRSPIVTKFLDPVSIEIDSLFNYKIPHDLFYDFDSDDLTYSVYLEDTDNPPEWLVFDQNTLELSGTPELCDVGVYTLMIRATDTTGLYKTTKLIIEVYNNNINTIQSFTDNIFEKLKITNIYLTNNKIKESYFNVLVGELLHNGGYNPYCIFDEGYNSTSGLFTQNTNMVRYAQPLYMNFPNIITISGAPQLFSIGSEVSARAANRSSLDIGDNTTVTKVFYPSIISGTPINHNIIYFTDIYTPWNTFAIFSGQNLPEKNLTDNFSIDSRANFIEDYGIYIKNNLLQESYGLILTEDKHALDHDYPAPKTKPHNYDSVAWSRQNISHKLYDELSKYHLADECNNTIISDNSSSYKHVEKARTTINITLLTENEQYLIDENDITIGGLNYDDRVWHTEKPIRVEQAYRENINYKIYDKHLNINLKYLNAPYFVNNLSQETRNKIFTEDEDTLISSTSQELSVSNIDYPRPLSSNASDLWIFDDINNAVLYFQKLGNDDVCSLVSDDRSYSGYFYNSEPYEYALLTTEDLEPLRPEQDTFNGSSIELSNRYEIIESINVHKDNKYLVSETNVFEDLVCENHDKLVDRYFINSQSGEAYVLFPGSNSHIALYYPNKFSYNKNFILNKDHNFSQLGYYEDNLEYRPSVLNFQETDFYYTWGTLVPYRFNTNEYAIELSNTYTGTTQSGLLLYSGIKPFDHHYYPEKTHLSNKSVLSGYCPENIDQSYKNGIEILTNNLGYSYITGTARFYTSYAEAKINCVSLTKDINKDHRTNDYVYVYGVTSSNPNALLPNDGHYDTVTPLSANTISFSNFFLYPSTKNINNTGLVSINLDRNHNLTLKPSNITNRIPIQFNSLFNTDNETRLPKNSLFDILNISGNKIYLLDNKNYNLISDKYFDGLISANYITNGISFLGSLFNNNTKIYDVRKLDNNFVSNYKNIVFEYDRPTQKLSISVPKNTLNIFDVIKLTDFRPLAPYMRWDSTRIYNTGFKIFPENRINKDADADPDKDYILLERSSIDLQPPSFTKFLFNTDIFPYSVSGSCSLDVSIHNRMEQGYLLNYFDSSYSSGHQYINHIDGYAFNGYIPKNNNTISTTGVIYDDRIGFASVFNTGNTILESGVRTLRQAQNTDIGYTEYYHTASSGFRDNYYGRYSGIVGVGSNNLWYTTSIDTTGNNKQLQFLYMGHNSNNIKLFGTVKTSGYDGFSVAKISLNQQNRIDELAKFGIVSGVSPIIATGTNSIEKSFDLTIPVNRFDQIIITLYSPFNNKKEELSYLTLNTYAQEQASPPALILQSPIVVNTGSLFYPRNTSEINTFHILPVFNTTLKYCNLNKLYLKNTNIYYNGNLIVLNNFSSINSYAYYNDQLKIETINNQNIPINYARHIQKINDFDNQSSINDQKLIITGISIDGEKSILGNSYDFPYVSLRENTNRNVTTFGTSKFALPNTGSITFTYNYSGTFNLINYNNIYTQTYGGYTSRWPQDIDGVLTDPPITGTYRILPKNTPCSSGKLCIFIDGYMNSLSSLQIGKSYFFDFDMYAMDLSNTYSIFDRVSPSTVTISTPYLERYEGLSGLVYIIPSKYNIKTNLNPNINNSFFIENPSFNNLSSFGLLKNQLHYYDIDTKKWTNVYHINGNFPTYSGYRFSIDNQASRLLYNDINPISIKKIEQINEDNTRTQIINNTINVYKNNILTSSKLLLSTTNGSPLFTGNVVQDAPKIFVSGLASYSHMNLQEPKVEYVALSGWRTEVDLYPLSKVGSYPIKIIANDETGISSVDLQIQVREQPRMLPVSLQNFVLSSDNSWYLPLYIKNLSMSDIQKITIGNDIYIINQENLASGINLKNGYIQLFGRVANTPLAQGAASWTPDIKLYVDNVVVASTNFATINLVNNNTDIPYSPVISNLNNKYIFNINDNNEDFSFTFDIPGFDNTDSLNINISPNIGSRFVEWDPELKHHRVRITISERSTTNLIPISLSYTILRQSNNTIYSSDTYTTTIIKYKPIQINQRYNLFLNNNFSMNQPWTYEFEVLEGIGKHSRTQPRINLINTPSYGNNSNSRLSYRVSSSYNENNQSYIISIIGVRDQYNRFAKAPGAYKIGFFVDDTEASSASGHFEVVYREEGSVQHIQPNIYTTPNNQFFINADILQNNVNSNTITFDGENSLIINNANYRYNNYFNIWEYYATGNKLTDKWDARLVINSDEPSIQVSCKGIATDKIAAVAKVDLIELQNNNQDLIDFIPIRITGIEGGSDPPGEDWTPESGLIVEQGHPWTLKFKTIKGLASQEYPPTILVSGQNILSTCSGFNPLLGGKTNQNLCLKDYNWDATEKAWNFIFSGDPSCTLLGEYDFKIQALDTNPNQDPIYLPNSFDVFESIFTYISGSEPHPGPRIFQNISEDEEDSLEVEPFCGNYRNEYKFGPRSREFCPEPTGLKNYITSGSLPPGLFSRIIYRYNGVERENPFFVEIDSNGVPIYNNLSSGTLIIEGSYTTYPTGEFYDETYYLTVTDARNLSSGIEIRFKPKISVLDPNIYSTMYFDNHLPVFSPSTGLEPVSDRVKVLQTAATLSELDCESNLPFEIQKKCTKINVLYSGAPANKANTNIVAILPLINDSTYMENFNRRLTNDNQIAYRILDNGSLSGLTKIEINQETKPDWITTSTRYIVTSTDLSQKTGVAEIVPRIVSLGTKPMGDMANLLGGSTTLSANSCLLGNGRFVNFKDKFGIGGFLSPFYSGILENAAVLDAQEIFPETGVRYVPIQNVSFDSYAEIKYTACRETGYVRISGVVLPPFYIEATDAPARTDNGSTQVVNPRLAYGNDSNTRNVQKNQRTGGTYDYYLKNLVTNDIVISGSTSNPVTIPANVLSSGSNNSGIIYEYFLNFTGNAAFPTFDITKLPRAIPSTYYWFHNTNNYIDPIKQTDYPPIVVVSPKTINVISGQIINVSGIQASAMGGYSPNFLRYPADKGPLPLVKYYSLDINNQPWNSSSYTPTISGCILKPINDNKNNILNVNAYIDINTSSVYINNANNLFFIEDSVNFIFTDNNVVRDNINIILEDTNIITQGISFNNNSVLFSSAIKIPIQDPSRYGQSKELIASYSYNFYIKSISNNNIIINNKNLPLNTGDNIVLDKPNKISTLTLNLINPDTKLTVENITSTEINIKITPSNNLLNNFTTSNIVDIYQLIEENIKTMPDNIKVNSDGIWNFDITGQVNVERPILDNNPYIYRILTRENPAMPVFSSAVDAPGWQPKVFYTDIPLRVHNPIRVGSVQILSWPADSWSIRLMASGGFNPKLSEYIDVKISIDDGNTWTYCGFHRYPIGLNPPVKQDTYDPITDTTIITLSSSTLLNWNNRTSFMIRIEDSTGFDIIRVIKDPSI